LIELPLPIETPRLLLRECRPGDGAEQYAARLESDAALMSWMPFARAEKPSLEQCEANCRAAHAKFLLREDVRIMAFERGSGKFVVSTGLHRMSWDHGIFEIGYWVRTPYAGKGYVTEAVNALTRYAFGQLGARRVSIFCNAENPRSAAIPQRLGFRLEGRLANHDRYADASIACRDELAFARTDLDGLPDLDVSW
jgi:RimJ/RimL family protein N-acetyltransferase